MGDDLTSRAGRYWTLFYQPQPESGERVAVALVLEEASGKASLSFDPSFAKVKKLFPAVDADSLAFYLHSLQEELRSLTDVEQVLNSYAPQVARSQAHRIKIPVSSAMAEILMSRYIYPNRSQKRRINRRQDGVSSELEAFVRASAPSLVDIRTGVGPRDILGRQLPGVRRVALAIRHTDGWTLVDGVDLNHATPAAVKKRADQISGTFWKYQRATSNSPLRIRRVGLVLNGSSHLDAAAHEAHDYALHRFTTDSDNAIDAASMESAEKLRELLRH